jgi:glutathione S-transferase
MIEITAYKWVPPFAQGLVRDLRVRWALEEAGLPYKVKLIALGPEQGSPEYRALQPFGQVPAFRENGLTLFESGAIVLHIAEKSDTLMPRDAKAREETITWLFAALNTVEMPIMFLVQLMFAGVTEGPIRESALQWIAKRLNEVSAAMQGRDYLIGDRFTVADLMMATVLNQLRETDLIAKQPTLAAWHRRCTERPAYKKVLADQLAVFKENAPPGND